MKTDNLFVPHMCANHPADNMRDAGAERPEKMNAHASDAGPHHLQHISEGHIALCKLLGFKGES